MRPQWVQTVHVFVTTWAPSAAAGHVGMVAGIDATGHVWLVEAPRTGLNVRLTPITAWAGQIVTTRRIG